MQVNTINCWLLLPHYFSPHKHQELLGHTVSQITLGIEKQRCQVYLSLRQLHLWSDIRNSLWIGMSAGEMSAESGTETLGPPRGVQVQGGWRSCGVYTQTHACSVTQVWNLFLSHCAGRSLVFAKTQTETALTLSFSDSLSTPLMLAQSALKKEKLWAEGKQGRKYSLVSLRLLTAAFVRWMEG